MSTPSELTLDCKPHSYSMLLKSFGEQNTYEHTQKLEEFLSRLEEERQKIDVFKRELPLCMQLLTNAVEASRQQLQAYRANQGGRPILEEFMPLKNPASENLEKSSNTGDKLNWMTTAQLWSHESNETKPNPTLTSAKESNNLGFNLDTKQRNGGAFLPFSKERNSCPSPTLALASPEKEEDKNCVESGKISVIEQGKGNGNQSADGQTTNSASGNSNNTNQTHRKARRCWSPDLHRRFVNALQMLGGSQVATPKQIRELMKVEGLTNDEVKSHLQKYRLHTRRPSPSPQAATAPAPQLVVLGGIWVPPEYSGGPAIYGAHHPPPPPHFCAAPPHQEFYTTGAPPQLHHQLQMYKAANQGSPESEMRGAGDRSESIEDGKSESSSGERKGLGGLREDGEESNGSEITLKF